MGLVVSGRVGIGSYFWIIGKSKYFCGGWIGFRYYCVGIKVSRGCAWRKGGIGY